ncbi:hypothetical protein BD410DRAFT_793297 [Rickenella mellea]|uniref:DUF6697 domain-containing protein n=1 Tax=Rickenella mellea TaxID=50990 RepID=A0A4Y7PUY0_9AGAM|nr:hypothetical protein BD410DRAFT_793297 [Rickenella mellea]
MSLFERLAAAGIAPLEVNVATKLLDATITRKFLSNICGGRMQSTFSDPDAKREYGKNRSAKTFVRLVQEFNGYAPQKPGMPGLFFGNSRYHVWPVSQEQVFTRLRSGDWLYQGDYEFIRCQSMTCAEYLLQTDGFRTSWSNRCQSAKWATYIRATIALREELHREPTGIEVDARIAAIAADRSIDKVTTNQIDTAFACGEEVIGIWAMKCIGYDASFKHTMIEQFNNWARLNEPENIRCEPGRKSHTRRTKMQAYPCSNSEVRRLQRIAPSGAASASGHIDAYEANVGHNELTQ